MSILSERETGYLVRLLEADPRPASELGEMELIFLDRLYALSNAGIDLGSKATPKLLTEGQALNELAKPRGFGDSDIPRKVN